MVIDLGPLEEFLLLDQAQEFRLADEAVAVSIDFAGSRRPGRIRDGIFQLRRQLEEAPQHRILPHSARTGDHDQEPLLGLDHLITAF